MLHHRDEGAIGQNLKKGIASLLSYTAPAHLLESVAEHTRNTDSFHTEERPQPARHREFSADEIDSTGTTRDTRSHTRARTGTHADTRTHTGNFRAAYVAESRDRSQPQVVTLSRQHTYTDEAHPESGLNPAIPMSALLSGHSTLTLNTHTGILSSAAARFSVRTPENVERLAASDKLEHSPGFDFLSNTFAQLTHDRSVPAHALNNDRPHRAFLASYDTASLRWADLAASSELVSSSVRHNAGALCFFLLLLLVFSVFWFVFALFSHSFLSFALCFLLQRLLC